MRKLIAMLPFAAVAACSGGGPESVGSIAPAGSGAVSVSAGNGSGVSAGNGTGSNSANTATSFLSVTGEKSFDLLGGAQSLKVDTGTGATLYAGNATTVRAPSGTVSYNPRDGIFTVTLADTKAIVSSNLRFQDPGHRIDFTSAGSPQFGVPDLQGFNYLESIGSTPNDTYTFFYQRPGTSTIYVSLAGYVRNNTPASGTTDTFERGAFVFGDQTLRSQIPASGAGTYKGGFVASMVNAPGTQASAFQWIQGSSALSVDFGKSTVSLSLSGTVNAPNTGSDLASSPLAIAAGSTFNATGTATIDLVKTSGFTGQFQSAGFTDAAGKTTAVDFAAISPGSSTAGASSIDGAFYGPDAVNVGGSLRIVGGIPNQRVDILGAFTGAKQ
ncbi:transferrin-binding protein-like solute binding protein [Sphingomonas profundi]|uniref:transferrin-binding protein-like solute binding protein n=1 Tax=Alterirhizorhabdus profundi TaxID=2681549 RepID=UPI0012E88EB5|nr:transferrin-binding protein-like solute binding protein [Sphingomonas profundi]